MLGHHDYEHDLVLSTSFMHHFYRSINEVDATLVHPIH